MTERQIRRLLKVGISPDIEGEENGNKKLPSCHSNSVYLIVAMFSAPFNKIACAVLCLCIFACSSPVKLNSEKLRKNNNQQVKGTYGYDVAFFADKKIETIELKDAESKSCILLVPDYQGRVMTSSVNGPSSQSFGWINYNLIESGIVNSQFNLCGGEESFSIGPEGGPFSIYFKQKEEQIDKNRKVPLVIDAEKLDIKKQNSNSVTFTKTTELTNASGFPFKIGIERKVTLLSRDTLWSLFHVDFPSGIFDVVAYQSDNTITNRGNNVWTKNNGLLSIWMHCMFNSSPSTTVFIPYKSERQGTVINDDYFGNVPSNSLIVGANTIFFKVDGAYGSKIGLPSQMAKEMCGSYNSVSNLLTLVWYSLPPETKDYVNYKWGSQDDPYNGDVINAYNGGPLEDGVIMVPFYEIETSSPAAKLLPGESITHTQRIMHIQGDELEMARLVNALFDINLYTMVAKFNKP